MKKNIRKLLDTVLKRFGAQTILSYELDYLKEKYELATSELYYGLQTFLFPEISLKKSRNRISLLMQLYGTGISEAIYIIHYLGISSKLQGDICEFGVANGATSSLIAQEIKNTSKHLWLFDSFHGLSKPTKKDVMINDIFNFGKMAKYEGSMSYSETEVIYRLKKVLFPRSRTHLIKGYIDKTLSQSNLPNKVCFAYVDFDLYEPTRDTLAFLHDRMAKKSHIVIDDYNFFSAGVKTAVSEFIKKHNEQYDLIIPENFAGRFCILRKKP